MTKKGDLVLQRERQRISMRETKEKNPYFPIMVNNNEPIALDRKS